MTDADTVLDFVGSQETLDAGCRALAPGGVLVVLGNGGGSDGVEEAATSARLDGICASFGLYANEWGERVRASVAEAVGLGDAAGVEQDAEAVVLEAVEAVPAALHLLHAQVQAFGGAVAGAGGVVGEDLSPPPFQGLAEADDLGDVIGEAAGDRLVEQGAGISPGDGEVDVTDGLLSSQAPSTSSLGSPARRPSSIRSLEAFVAGEEHLADPIERVGLAAPVAEGVVLHAATHLVEAPVGDVRSDRGAVSLFPAVGFPGPSPEPDVRLPPFLVRGGLVKAFFAAGTGPAWVVKVERPQRSEDERP